MRLFELLCSLTTRKPFYRKGRWTRCATIAQSVEQPPCKRQVGSSILPGGFSARVFLQEESGAVLLARDLTELDIEARGEAQGLRVQWDEGGGPDSILPSHLADDELRVAADEIRARRAAVPFQISQTPQQQEEAVIVRNVV